MSLLFAALLGCATNTGLDPSCMRSAAGIASSTTALTASASESTLAVSLSRALDARSEFDIQLPVHDRLSIDAFGAANGTGDLGLSYRRRLSAEPRLWNQTLGVAFTLPTGAPTFTTGRATIAPAYTLSYYPRPSIALIGIAQYAVPAGGTREPFAPLTQTLNVRGRALGITRRSVYAAIEAGVSRTTGSERYTAYDGRATLGAIIARHYNAGIWYEQPFSQFTKDDVFQHGWGASLTLQR